MSDSKAAAIAQDLMAQNMLDVPCHVAIPVIEKSLAPGVGSGALTGYELAGCADSSGVVVYLDGQTGNARLMVAGDWDRFAAEIRRTLSLSEVGKS